MQIGGLGSSWDYKYKSAVESNAGAFSIDGAGGNIDAIEERQDAFSMMNGIDNLEEDGYRYKVASESAYEAELAQAKEEDIERYYAMIAEREEGMSKPFSELEKEAAAHAGSDGSGTAEYKGVAIDFNFFYKTMSIGNMGGDNVINVGQLSNGYNFSFNRDNLDSVIAILDIFSPEDINKIMEAITKDNMKNNMEQEIDATVAEAGQNAGGQSEDIAQAAEAGTDASEPIEEEEQLGEMAQQDRLDSLLSDKLNQPAAADGSAGSGSGTEEEQTEITSEIVVNSDGSRNLIITTTIGENQIITKMPLSPLREHNEYHRQKGVEAYEEQMFTGVGVGDVEG